MRSAGAQSFYFVVLSVPQGSACHALHLYEDSEEVWGGGLRLHIVNQLPGGADVPGPWTNSEQQGLGVLSSPAWFELPSSPPPPLLPCSTFHPGEGMAEKVESTYPEMTHVTFTPIPLAQTQPHVHFPTSTGWPCAHLKLGRRWGWSVA